MTGVMNNGRMRVSGKDFGDQGNKPVFLFAHSITRSIFLTQCCEILPGYYFHYLAVSVPAARHVAGAGRAAACAAAAPARVG